MAAPEIIMKRIHPKLALTLLVGIALSLPIIYPSMGGGFLEEMKVLGMTGAVFVVAMFLGLPKGL